MAAPVAAGSLFAAAHRKGFGGPWSTTTDNGRAEGTDECGLFLVETAARLLSELYDAQAVVVAEQDTVGMGD